MLTANVALAQPAKEIVKDFLDENVLIVVPVATNRVTTISFPSAINAFTGVMNLPRGQIVNRSTLLKEVDTDTADLLEQVADMDDLVLQFDGTDAGKRFIEAWKRARIIVDTGGGHSGTPPTPPIPPATPKP